MERAIGDHRNQWTEPIPVVPLPLDPCFNPEGILFRVILECMRSFVIWEHSSEIALFDVIYLPHYVKNNRHTET